MAVPNVLERGRKAFRQQVWRQAYTDLSAADRLTHLASDDLERLATSAYLTGEDEASADAWARAHHAHVDTKEVPRAARCAFWLILQLLSAGEWSRAGGWIARAQRLLDEGHHDCPERDLLLVLVARRHLKEGRVSAAFEASSHAASRGARFGDAELTVFGRLGLGQVLARKGDAAAAALLFDEIMVGVTTGGISPIAVGTVYCAVIDACYEMLDLGRAREWTEALSRWCSSQPELVPFRGRCLVHRAETMRLKGAWSSAMEEAAHAYGDDEISSRGEAVGAAYYEVAEICRMRGRFDEAQQAYREANRRGRPPEPGLAFLRMAQGRLTDAEAAIRRALDQPQKRLMRANVLAACVEIMIRVGDFATASRAVDELSAMADGIETPFLRAVSGQAQGALLLAESEPRASLDVLRAAWKEWRAIDVPYEEARVRMTMGLDWRALGDEDAAEMEFDAARLVFLRLGAAPEVARANELLAAPSTDASLLTPRELEVIRLLAAGKSNRAIAHELTISERTVDRHVSNIFTKLEVSSRAAATAFAFKHGLL